MKNSYGDFDGKAPLAKDLALQDIVLEALTVRDPAAKHEAYVEMYKALREESYAFGAGYVDLPWGVGSRITSWEPWPMNSNPTAWWTIALQEK